MKFWELYRIVSRRRWLVVGLVVVTLAAIYTSTLDDKPYYRATVKIMPSDSALYSPLLPSPAESGTGPMTNPKRGSQLPNLMSLIVSREVAERTIRTAGIQDSPDGLRGRIEVGTAANPGARSRQELGTDIIEIRVKDGEPERAVRTVNALAHVFAGFYQEISHQEAADSRKFIEAELVTAKDALEEASSKLQAFKREKRVTTIDDTAGSAMGQYRQAVQNRDAARAALAEADARLREIDGQLRRIGPTRTVEEGTSNTPVVAELEAQLASLTRQLNDARARYEDVHPQVVNLNESIEEVKSKLETEKGKLRTTTNVIRNPVYENLLHERSKAAYERNGLSARVSQLEASVARASSELTPGMDVTLARLENDFSVAQTRYTDLQTQLNQARLNEKETTAAGAIRIVDEAVHASGPIGINRTAYLLLGAMLSMVVGIGLAITLESLDNTIRSNKDVEGLLSLPVTALIPRCTGSSDSKLARVVYTDPLSPISEAYRFLRTDFLLSAQATNAKTIMLATAKPGQGGTCTAANLAISLAQDGKRVVLVDADMRRPSLHRVFKVGNEYGLSNVLSNEKDLDDVIVGTEIDNLLFMPAGPAPSNPSELLGSVRMKKLMQMLTEHADYVLFDTPSAIAFTDAVVMSQIVDGVILVVRAQQVSRGAELQVRNLLNKANANILGVVLNDVQPESVDSYYFHSHYYPEVGGKMTNLPESLTKARSLPPTEETG